MNRLIASAFVCWTMLFAAAGAKAGTWLEDGESSSHGVGNGNSIGWVNQRTGVVGTFTDAASSSDAFGRECREYTFTAEIAGNRQEIFGIACREPDGSWREASASFEPQPDDQPLQTLSTDPYPSSPEPGPAPYPYAGWDRWYSYPSIGLSASYCFSGFCFGSGYSTRNYYGYGYPYYGDYRYGYPYYGLFNFGYYNYGHSYGHDYRHHYGHNYRGHNYGNHNYGNHSYRNRGHRDHNRAYSGRHSSSGSYGHRSTGNRTSHRSGGNRRGHGRKHRNRHSH